MGKAANDGRRRILKRYLSQYYRAKERQSALRRRLEELQAELRHPGASSPPFDATPVRGRTSNGAASLVFKIGEVEERIQKQIENEVKSVTDIMDMLELLPSGSMERSILEYRHIDCYPWGEIMSCVHFSRSSCFDYYNKGLDKLLAMETVQATLSEFEARLPHA